VVPSLEGLAPFQIAFVVGDLERMPPTDFTFDEEAECLSSSIAASSSG
jgi:hypothetical protein